MIKRCRDEAGSVDLAPGQLHYGTLRLLPVKRSE